LTSHFCYTFLKLNFYFVINSRYQFTLSVHVIMVLTIDTLLQRIYFLEIQIQHLLKHNKHTLKLAFTLFEQAFYNHVSKYLFKIHFDETHNYNFKPKSCHIKKEIRTMWNNITYEEKLHWLT